MPTMTKLSEAEQIRRGKLIAEVLDLKENWDGRYKTSWGDKTPLGLFLTLERLIVDGK